VHPRVVQEVEADGAVHVPVGRADRGERGGRGGVLRDTDVVLCLGAELRVVVVDVLKVYNQHSCGYILLIEFK